MNRSDLGLLALVPALAYAVVHGVQAVAPLDAVAGIGALSALAPAVGLVRRDLAVLGWLPGIFFTVVLFTVAGISANALPGALGDLAGGFALCAPFFLLLGAAASPDEPGRRAALLVLSLLAAAAVLAAAQIGPGGSAANFAVAFAQIPRAQASALGGVLTGASSGTAPFVAVASSTFSLLVLLAGAGALASLLGVDPSRDPEGLGFDAPTAPVPEGTYRSLLPDGRLRLNEATPAARPVGPDTTSVLSVLGAAAAGLTSLLVATYDPDDLISVTAGITIALLVGVLLTMWRTRVPLTAPAPPALPPARP